MYRLTDTALLVALLAVHAALLGWSASRQSPTLNEPAHVVAGISHWRFGRFELYRVNPPLVRMIAALPVLAAGYEEDWSGFYEAPGARPVFSMGEHFVSANGPRSIRLMVLARWALVPVSLAGAVVCYLWARELYGVVSGLLAASFWCFSPNVLGHAHLITPDTGAAALSLAACYAFWRWLRHPHWNRALLAGVALGLALLTKFTVILVAVTWPVLWAVYRWSGPPRQKESFRGLLREATMLLVVILVSLYVLNAGYGFEGPLPKLRDFHFVSRVFRGADDQASVDAKSMHNPETDNRFRHGWLAGLRAPVPRNYLVGIDVQQHDFEISGRQSYLCGIVRSKGWWYYYLYAVAVKTPLAAWLVAGATIAMRLAGNRPFAEHKGEPRLGLGDELVLFVPPLVIFVAVSSQTAFNQHLRYVFPAFPFLYVWLSQIGALAARRSATMAHAAAVLMAWSVVSSLWIYPHTLSYFNELAGGPAGGHRHLLHSNIDWGQDLLNLRRWMDAHPEARPLHLAYCGAFDPGEVGFGETLPVTSIGQTEGTAAISSGDQTSARHSHETQSSPRNAARNRWYAVSVNLIYATDGPVRDGVGQVVNWNSQMAAGFRQRRPVASAGYSIHIFRLPPDDTIASPTTQTK